MMTKAVVKAWGSSLGVVIPRNVVNKEHLREGVEIVIEVKKKHSLRHIFGSLKNWKVDSQKVKDRLREEWAR